MEIAEISGLHECPTWWSELPKNLKENVLAWLPAESLCRYCGVCKEWNALFSCTQFITNEWLAAPPNKKPWLLLFHDWKSLNCMAYCFFTGTWKRLSLAFLRNQYMVAGFWVNASAAGLFLGTVESINPRGYYELKRIVCNPLTGKSIELPRIKDDGIRAIDDVNDITMVAEEGHGHNGSTYKVIAVVRSAHGDRVEMYDSSLKSWSRAGHLPQNFHTLRIVASGDFLYVNSVDVNSSRQGIVAFSIQNGTSVFTPLPLEDVDNSRRNVLFTCGSRVLLGSCISDTDDIIIWELENSHRFTEIARMSLNLDSHRRNAGIHYGSLMLAFEGIRNLVCITSGDDVLVYNLNQKTSTWLPRCPIHQLPQHTGGIPACFVFQTRQDMDV